jgi:PTH1 family peptidyl-tRNA hydrolase
MITTYAFIGLGNPGPMYSKNRHNIGFMVLDAFAQKHHATWKVEREYATAEVAGNGYVALLVKPLTGMNNSGIIKSLLKKRNILLQNSIVVHDELEIPFGKITLKQGGSARGHNGLRSIIAACGADFYRLRFGIGRPENRENVPDYVLSNFTESKEQLQQLIETAVEKLNIFPNSTT